MMCTNYNNKQDDETYLQMLGIECGQVKGSNISWNTYLLLVEPPEGGAGGGIASV